MWLDRIIELRQDTMRNQIDPLLLFSRELPFCFVQCRVPIRLAAQPRLRFRGTNEFENLFVADQRLSSPIAGDLREQAVLDSPRSIARNVLRAHLIPVIGSPAVASCSDSFRAFRSPGCFFQLLGGRLQFGVCVPQLCGLPAGPRRDRDRWCSD
jgi:hypothetical protein